ncbi:MAG: diacylglycerol kinase [Flavobacteriaceae bacterium]|nr:diacylglycerol kinase [Flavobacteriaceae bacterium]MAU30762.1 diacylglycerol kinase [Flavobacteriaceae bacterium]|tara:strand:+ start:97 stop:594 length:498 start_codon:yes stop_codon:yes gene_type:complete
MKKSITIIVAAAENNAIGKDNDLIWSLPNDLKRFKKLTSGHSIIMGRKTFDSFPGLLPNRKHIVISRNKNISFSDEVTVVNNFEDAIRETGDDENPFIIGGGQIYKLAMDLGDKIELTRVHEEFKADTFFPKIDEDKWELINEKFNEKDERHQFSFTYKTYIKIK